MHAHHHHDTAAPFDYSLGTYDLKQQVLNTDSTIDGLHQGFSIMFKRFHAGEATAHQMRAAARALIDAVEVASALRRSS